MIPERGIAVDKNHSPMMTQIWQRIDDLGWGALTQFKCDYDQAVVHEFYTNLHDIENGVVKVRGRNVRFTEAIINEVL